MDPYSQIIRQRSSFLINVLDLQHPTFGDLLVKHELLSETELKTLKTIQPTDKQNATFVTDFLLNQIKSETTMTKFFACLKGSGNGHICQFLHPYNNSSRLRRLIYQEKLLNTQTRYCEDVTPYIPSPPLVHQTLKRNRAAQCTDPDEPVEKAKLRDSCETEALKSLKLSIAKLPIATGPEHKEIMDTISMMHTVVNSDMFKSPQQEHEDISKLKSELSDVKQKLANKDQERNDLLNDLSKMKSDLSDLQEGLNNVSQANQEETLLEDEEPPFSPQQITVESVSSATQSKILLIEEKMRNLETPENLHVNNMDDFYKMKQGLLKKDCYKIQNEVRGIAIIVTMTGARKGWENDVIALETMFRYLKISTDYHYDLTKTELSEVLRSFAKNKKIQAVDSVFVILMGHGASHLGKEYLITADGKFFPVMEKFKETFNNKNNHSLIGKPKVLILQMCRGGKFNEALEVSPARIQSDVTVLERVAGFTDYLFGFSTQSGEVSHRNEETGSWYIQFLTDIFIGRSHELPVTDMLALVNQKLQDKSQELYEGAQVSETVSGLSYPLYLFPGYCP